MLLVACASSKRGSFDSARPVGAALLAMPSSARAEAVDPLLDVAHRAVEADGPMLPQPRRPQEHLWRQSLERVLLEQVVQERLEQRRETLRRYGRQRKEGDGKSADVGAKKRRAGLRLAHGRPWEFPAPPPAQIV